MSETIDCPACKGRREIIIGMCSGCGGDVEKLRAQKIEAADRGMNWSFWKSEDGKRVAICYPSMSSKWWMTTTNEDDEDDVNQSQEAAEAAAAKYVGGEG
mgnify:CR=1 FL=1